MSGHTYENEAIRAALEALLADFQCAQALLLPAVPRTSMPPKSATKSSSQTIRSMRSAKSSGSIHTLKAKLSLSPTRAFFSRMAAPFRLVRSRSQRKAYGKLEESRLLSSPANSARRASDDSDQTLVDAATAPEEVSPPADPWSASHLLEVLAPLISSLQHITPRLMGACYLSDDAKNEHADICARMLRFIDQLRGLLVDHHQTANEPVDSDSKGARGAHNHDLEMTSLMLDALVKKIEHERGAVYRLSVTESCDETDDSDWEETVVGEAELVQIKKGADGSPLLPTTKKPFVLHSTSITLSARRGSENRPIPAGAAQAVAPGNGHSSLVGGVQPTWSRNVIRLGSYQNSLIFSPSPVAVRPMVGISQQL